MKKALLISSLLTFAVCIMIGGLLYFVQETLIFFPQKLPKNYPFQFDQPFEEKIFTMKDGTALHGILFKADSSKGLIFYLHGNAGALDSWGGIAQTYTDLNYDVFILDYRGYGKSESKINGQTQLFEDVQTVYDELKKQYNEDQIIVLGYSIGTGPASKLASTNQPKLLILQAPYYSFKDLVKTIYPWAPGFLLKYQFQNNVYLKACKMPVVIFHGDQDEVIYYGSSLKLKEECATVQQLITLKGQGHNGITDNEVYKIELKNLLQSQLLK